MKARRYFFKAEVDHETLTYLAKLQDEQMTELKGTELWFFISAQHSHIGYVHMNIKAQLSRFWARISRKLANLNNWN